MRISDWSSDVCSSDLALACSEPDYGYGHRVYAGDDPAPFDRYHDQRTGAHPRSAGAQARARHHPRSKAGDRADEISDRRYRQERRACERAPAEGGGAMKRLIPSALPIVSAALALSACNQNRSEEHTSELQSLMRISYAVFCLK